MFAWGKSLTIIILFLALVTPCASAYETTFWNDNTGASPIDSVVPSLKVADTCTVKITGYADASNTIPAPISLTSQYFSPGNNLLISGTKAFAEDVVCFSFGEYTTTEISENETYEAKTTLIYNSDNTKNYVNATYVCDPGDDRYMNYTLEYGDKDSRGNIPNMYHYTMIKSCFVMSHYTALDFTPHFIKTNDSCKTITPLILPGETTYNTGIDYACMGSMLYFPFTTGITGKVNFNLSCTGKANAGCVQEVSGYDEYSTNWYVYPFDNPLDITTLGGLTVNEVDYVLQPNTEYVAAFMYSADAPGSAHYSYKVQSPVYANIDVYAYEPDYSICGDWTECDPQTSQRRRVCEDANGIEEPIFEYEYCVIPFIADVYLGFEEFTITENGKWFCEATPLLCLPGVITTIDMYTPVGWTISRTSATDPAQQITAVLENFDTIITNDASEGSSSLGLWSIPIKEFEPIEFTIGVGDIVTCGNYTKARFPETYTFYNESLFVSYNITFENPYAQIVYDVKKCPETPVQFDYPGFFGSCTSCYGDCDGEPAGAYGVRVVEIGEGRENYHNKPFKFYDEAGVDITDKVIENDYFTEFIRIQSLGTTPRIELINDTFDEETYLTFIFMTVGINKDVYLTNATDVDNYGLFNTGNIIVGKVVREIKLSDVPNGTNIIYLSHLGLTGNFDIYLDQVKVERYEKFPTYNVIYDTNKEAPITWTPKEIDFSTSPGMFEEGKNYTIAFGIKSAEYTGNSTCIYLDNVRVTYREGIQVCESKCDPDNPTDYKEALFEDGVCTYTIYKNDYRCVSEWEEGQTEGCQGTTWVYLDESNNWQYIHNSTLCIEEEIIEGVTETEAGGEVRTQLDAVLKLANVTLTDIQLFLVSFFIGVVALVGVGGYMSHKDVDERVVLASMIVIMYAIIIFELWPWELGLLISAAIILLLADAGKSKLTGSG